jgi:hypothetical protein
MFGNRHILRRVTAAVEQALEPGETLIVPVYLHTYQGSDLRVLLAGGTLPGTGITTWIAAVTDRRFLIFEGNELNAAKSRFLGAVPRHDVAVLSEGSPAKPTHLTFRIGVEAGHRFAVPLVWRKEAGRLAQEFSTPSR